MIPFKKIVLSIILLISSIIAQGQCKDQVNHTEGSAVVGNTSVKVEAKGQTTVLLDYCENTRPYHVGYSFDDEKSKDGSYVFTFDPPIRQARLNFSGISNVVGSEEEVSIYVNGQHYKITEVGEENDCDDLALITERGNIGVAEKTSVGGWSGTVIEGPITTLEIKDSVLVGQPAGAVFSLFICSGLDLDLGPDTLLCEGETLILDPGVEKGKIKWQDGSKSEQLKVTKPGTYIVEVTIKNITYSDSITVAFDGCDDKDPIPRSEHWKHLRESGG